MESTEALPPIENFYSSLSEETISIKNYNFAQEVWYKFEIKNLRQYCELYCEIDNILLAEVFTKFRKSMLEFSNLDPCHYVSLPSFAWDTMLKVTNCCLGLPTDIDMVYFIENGIRGGLSFINTRYAQIPSSNRNSADQPNSKKHVKSDEAIIYIDANNLYGGSQEKSLPYDRYAWVSDDKIRKFDPLKTDLNGDIGYILEVDLEYPQKHHHHHSDYPLAPENYEICLDDLSRFSQREYLKYNKSSYKSKKLTSTFFDRKKYVIHIQNLVLYMQLGMKLLKIHRILQFRQKPFLLDFIRKCTSARKKAASDFEKNQFKKVANSCYGMTISNIREYISVKIHTSEKSFLKATSSHTFKNYNIIDQDIIVTSHFLPTVTHNKPYAVGFSILEFVSILKINLKHYCYFNLNNMRQS